MKPERTGASKPRTPDLLAEHTNLMNRFGADSVEAESFVQEHQEDEEFVQLALLAQSLKRERRR